VVGRWRPDDACRFAIRTKLFRPVCGDVGQRPLVSGPMPDQPRQIQADRPQSSNVRTGTLRVIAAEGAGLQRVSSLACRRISRNDRSTVAALIANAEAVLLTHVGKPRLLIADELGYRPFEPNAEHLFFQRASRRYERGSIFITSNGSIAARRFTEGVGDYAKHASIARLGACPDGSTGTS
jgi:IstB-like ATP binding protein